VVDATNVLPEARVRLMAIAQRVGAPVVMLRFAQSTNVLMTQNAEREKRLSAQQVRDYVALMAVHATGEQLRSDDVWAVHDVPGRDRQVSAAQAAAVFEFEVVRARDDQPERRRRMSTGGRPGETG